MLEYTTDVGTGDGYVDVSGSEKLRLENKLITSDMAMLFLQFTQIPAHIEFSLRPTKTVWGTAWWRNKRIILYRHSVWTFLHELAHIVAQHSGHGGDFPIALRGLYLKWKEVE